MEKENIHLALKSDGNAETPAEENVKPSKPYDYEFCGNQNIFKSTSATSEPQVNLKITTCPMRLFGVPSSRISVTDYEDSILLKYLISLHRSQQDPGLYFKWGIWESSSDLGIPKLQDILETEVQLMTWNKSIKKSSPCEVAYLRLGLHPNRKCGKIAFQVNIEQSQEFFEKMAELVLREEISMPMEIHSTCSQKIKQFHDFCWLEMMEYILTFSPCDWR